MSFKFLNRQCAVEKTVINCYNIITFHKAILMGLCVKLNVQEDVMKRKSIIIILFCLHLLLSFSKAYPAQEKKINLLGQDICPNSAGALLRDELSGITGSDTLIVVIEKDRKEIIQTAIKLERLPVSYEEKDEKDITIFILKLK